MILKIVMYFIFVIVILLNFIDVFYNSKIDSAIMIPSGPSDIHIINWRVILLDMLKNVSFFDDIDYGSVLLVNIIKNNTNGILQNINITNILIELISENTKKYNVISIKKLYETYRALEISSEDFLNSYFIALEIANYLHADYIIYGFANGDANKPSLELQLISSKTGEIIRVINKSIE